MKRALITGATGGLGQALAKLLHQQGISLLLTGRDTEKLVVMEKEYGAEILPLNLASDRKPLIDWIRQKTPDLVINNAGYAYYGDILSHTAAQELAVLEVNANALLEITLEAARALKEKKLPGTILNVSSVAGEYTFPGMAVYAAAKAFVTSFSQSIDFEMRSSDIRVLVALPGAIETGFARHASRNSGFENHSQAMDSAHVAKLIWNQIHAQRPYQIIDWRYGFSLFFSRFLPKEWLSRSLYKTILSRLK